MTTWRLRLKPGSPWATPWRADSLFGALCWRWLELFPESFHPMLEGFRVSTQPPFVVSDAFPYGSVPLPLHVSLTESGGGRRPRPPLYVDESLFRDSIQTGTTGAVPALDPRISAGARLQTSIDRETGTAAEGQLFATGTESLSHGELLSVFIRTQDYLGQLVACFRALSVTGFGKKSSTGLGSFTVVGEPEPCPWLDVFPNANAFVALGHFVPAAGDPTDGRWRVQVTYPKFHANSVTNVFKGSIVTLAPGAVFRADGQPPRRWYGRMVAVPRPEMAGALHYGLCFAAPIVWPAEAR